MKASIWSRMAAWAIAVFLIVVSMLWLAIGSAMYAVTFVITTVFIAPCYLGHSAGVIATNKALNAMIATMKKSAGE